MNGFERLKNAAKKRIAYPYRRFPTTYSKQCTFAMYPTSDTVSNTPRQLYHLSPFDVRNIGLKDTVGTRIEYVDPALEAECIRAFNAGEKHFFAIIPYGTATIVNESDVAYEYSISSGVSLSEDELRCAEALADSTPDDKMRMILESINQLREKYGDDAILNTLQSIDTKGCEAHGE
jgi:hypothetical protein